MKFHDNIPENCPNLNETEVADRDLFKAIDGRQAKAGDFESFAEQGREGIDPLKCQSWGLSVWPDMNAVQHARRIFNWLKKKNVIKFSITAVDGRLKATPSKEQPDHHTFWKAKDVNLLNSCEIALKPEVK